jgi:3'-phosphoadenosine 5'-phosphosulfate sulfotransferase (PAPS reductase)/FAD synthetase
MKHIVGFSGGIDSQACCRWVLNQYPAADVIITNSSAGQWEDPLTIEHVDWYDAYVHPVIRTEAIVADLWETPGYAEKRGFDGNAPLTYQQMCVIKGRAPSRMAQFCTKILKLKPCKRWLVSAFGVGGTYEGEDYCLYKGVRREESPSRADTPREQWDEYFDCRMIAPLVDWTKQQCFDYVQSYGERINPLYTMGFNRVGCMPCINISKEDIVNTSIRRPDAIQKVRALEGDLGRTFFSAKTVPGIDLAFIDQVIEWAHTARGGRQQLFPIFHEREACESKYGLCE